jgi:hypothetical protein
MEKRNADFQSVQLICALNKPKFHLLLFIFNGSDGITHVLLNFKGVRELKVRQIDHNIIFGW